uniref:RxLR effector candidate protein n=1 Tax=Hyaloperonospora arabidopsidis (strain Emoy2) TaxID=559515 RepID=M4BSX5_HYAAE
MYQGIETLQSLYKRTGYSFEDSPPSTKGASRRTARQDRAHPSSGGSGVPRCSTTVDTPAAGRSNSSLILNRHGGSRYDPQGSVDHRVSLPNDVEEEERPPTSRSTHHLDPYEMGRAIVELREDLEHERDRRYALNDSVRNHRKDREADRSRDRADYILAQLQVEHDVRSLVDEQATTRKEISQCNGEVSSLLDQTDRLEREPRI